MKLVFLGLSITSSWGNGHATNYRALMRALDEAGHDVVFLERNVPWYERNRDLPRPPWGRTVLYGSPDELKRRHYDEVRSADAVLVGSFVPDGVAVGEWVTETCRGVTVFYDIDTPVTIEKLERGDREYVDRDLVKRYDLYLSFTGGPTLARLEAEFGARSARAFYCLVDTDSYAPMPQPTRWSLGYLGTYSEDRQAKVDRLLNEVARRSPDRSFVVAGPNYPVEVQWPENVERIDHLPPSEHPRFYASQGFTLNVTRDQMAAAGWSPSVRLFEAAACAVPVISDPWPGLEEIFRPGDEILIAHDSDEVHTYIEELDQEEARAIGNNARKRVLKEHSAQRRAQQLIGHIQEVG